MIDDSYLLVGMDLKFLFGSVNGPRTLYNGWVLDKYQDIFKLEAFQDDPLGLVQTAFNTLLVVISKLIHAGLNGSQG